MSFLPWHHLSVKETIVEYRQWLLANEKLVFFLQPVSELKNNCMLENLTLLSTNWTKKKKTRHLKYVAVTWYIEETRSGFYMVTHTALFLPSQ